MAAVFFLPVIVVVHFTTCCLCQQVTNLVVLGTRYLRSWKFLPPPPWSCFPCHRCSARPSGEVRRSEGLLLCHLLLQHNDERGQVEAEERVEGVLLLRLRYRHEHLPGELLHVVAQLLVKSSPLPDG